MASTEIFAKLRFLYTKSLFIKSKFHCGQGEAAACICSLIQGRYWKTSVKPSGKPAMPQPRLDPKETTPSYRERGGEEEGGT